MSVTDAAQQCNRDFNHWRKVVDLVKEVRQELCQGRLRAFPEERFVLVSGLIFFVLAQQPVLYYNWRFNLHSFI